MQRTRMLQQRHRHIVTEQYYVQDLHSAGNVMQERIARKFHLLHTKQVNAQFGNLTRDMLLNAEMLMPERLGASLVDAAETDRSLSLYIRHPMPARQLPRCLRRQESQATRWGEDLEATLRPQMAEIMHARAALRKGCPNQTSSESVLL